MPSVAISDGTRRRVTAMPLASPHARAMPRPAAMATGTGSPVCTRAPVTTAARLATSATDRSSSAVTSASVKPIAIMARKLVSLATFNRLTGAAKLGAAIAKKHTNAMPAIAVPYFSRIPRINYTPALLNNAGRRSAPARRTGPGAGWGRSLYPARARYRHIDAGEGPGYGRQRRFGSTELGVHLAIDRHTVGPGFVAPRHADNRLLRSGKAGKMPQAGPG